MIVPEMGMKREGSRLGLAGALFTPVQQRVLGLLFGQPDRSFQGAEIIRLAGSGTGAVHRQLRRLEDAGLVDVRRQGNQKHYRANRNAPVFEELHGLVVKTVGLVDPLREALEPLSDRIEVALVYGSVAAGGDHAESDVDLLVISDELTYADVFEAVEPAERILARPVNPTVMTRQEWRTRAGKGDSFAARVGKRPQLMVLGDMDALA